MPDGQKVLLFLVNISYKNLDGSPFSTKSVYVAQEHGSPGSPMVRLDLLFIGTLGGCLKKTAIWRCEIVQKNDTVSYHKVSRGYKVLSMVLDLHVHFL